VIYEGENTDISYYENLATDPVQSHPKFSCEDDQILISAEADNFDVTICGMEGKSLRNYRGNGCLSIDKSDFNKGIYSSP